MFFKSRSYLKIKTRGKISMMVLVQNFYVLSNGEFAFAACLKLCTGKWIKLFTEAVLALNLHFEHIRLNLLEST
jgi:hypothetical protein